MFFLHRELNKRAFSFILIDFRSGLTAYDAGKQLFMSVVGWSKFTLCANRDCQAKIFIEFIMVKEVACNVEAITLNFPIPFRSISEKENCLEDPIQSKKKTTLFRR